MDDSGLAQRRRCRVDRTFGSSIGRCNADTTLAASIIALAASLGLHVAAEGVEHAGQH